MRLGRAVKCLSHVARLPSSPSTARLLDGRPDLQVRFLVAAGGRFGIARGVWVGGLLRWCVVSGRRCLLFGGGWRSSLFFALIPRYIPRLSHGCLTAISRLSLGYLSAISALSRGESSGYFRPSLLFGETWWRDFFGFHAGRPTWGTLLRNSNFIGNAGLVVNFGRTRAPESSRCTFCHIPVEFLLRPVVVTKSFAPEISFLSLAQRGAASKNLAKKMRRSPGSSGGLDREGPS